MDGWMDGWMLMNVVGYRLIFSFGVVIDGMVVIEVVSSGSSRSSSGQRRMRRKTENGICTRYNRNNGNTIVVGSLNTGSLI